MSYNHFIKQTNQKLYENNKVKSTHTDPHNRNLIIPNTPRLVFAKMYGTVFCPIDVIPTESNSKTVDELRSSPMFSVKTLTKLQDVFQA